MSDYDYSNIKFPTFLDDLGNELPPILEIPRGEILKLCFGLSDTINIRELAWWLECKTEKRYTIVESAFLFDAMEVAKLFTKVEEINGKIISFSNLWTKRLNSFSSKYYTLL